MKYSNISRRQLQTCLVTSCILPICYWFMISFPSSIPIISLFAFFCSSDLASEHVDSWSKSLRWLKISFINRPICSKRLFGFWSKANLGNMYFSLFVCFEQNSCRTHSVLLLAEFKISPILSLIIFGSCVSKRTVSVNLLCTQTRFRWTRFFPAVEILDSGANVDQQYVTSRRTRRWQTLLRKYSCFISLIKDKK